MKANPAKSNTIQLNKGRDHAWRAYAERDLTYLRWVLLGLVATLYLLFSNNVQYPALGWATIGVGLLMNGLFLYLVQKRSFSLAWSIVAQGADIALLQFYVASLASGSGSYMPLYTTMVITATIRFGIVGALSSGALGIFLYLTTLSAQYSPSPEAVAGALIADTALLVYWAYLVHRQEVAQQKNERTLKEQIEKIAVLYEVSNSVHDLKSEDALQNIVKITTEFMGFQRAALFLTDSIGETLPRQYHSQNQNGRRQNLPNLFMDQSLFEAVLQGKTPIVVDGSQGLPDVSHKPAIQIAVPLHSDQAAIGVLVADRNDRDSISQSDKEMLSSLAKSAVMAIENASLHRQVKRMANHDGLTELYNHRYFQEALRATIRDAPKEQSVSLLMIEIDKFKRYNDTFGHRQGDKALFSLARALEQSSTPWQGLVARYGGDEFVIILNHTSQQEGRYVAHEIWRRARQLAAEMLQKENLPSLSLSVGVATYPDDAQTAADLIDAADQAMYVVKHSGGNQVGAYSKSLRRVN